MKLNFVRDAKSDDWNLRYDVISNKSVWIRDSMISQDCCSHGSHVVAQIRTYYSLVWLDSSSIELELGLINYIDPK